MKNYNPCKNCEKRKDNCNSKCGKYKVWCYQNQQDKEKLKEYKKQHESTAYLDIYRESQNWRKKK